MKYHPATCDGVPANGPLLPSTSRLSCRASPSGTGNGTGYRNAVDDRDTASLSGTGTGRRASSSSKGTPSARRPRSATSVAPVIQVAWPTIAAAAMAVQSPGPGRASITGHWHGSTSSRSTATLASGSRPLARKSEAALAAASVSLPTTQPGSHWHVKPCSKPPSRPASECFA